MPMAPVRLRRVLFFYILALVGQMLCCCVGDYTSPDVALVMASFVPVMAALFVVKWYNDCQPSIAFALRLLPPGIKFEEVVLFRSDGRGVLFWWLAALIIPVVLLFVTIGVDIMLPGVEYSPNFELVLAQAAADPNMNSTHIAHMKAALENSTVHPLISTVGTAMFLGPTVYMFTSLGQECAWRGWLLRELSPLGYWQASLIVGLMSGLWHAPAVLQGWHYSSNPTLQAYPILGVALVTSLCTVESPMAVLIQWHTHSTLATAAFRGVSNGVGTLDHFVINIPGGNADVDLEAWVGSTGVAGLIVSLLAVVCIGLVSRIRDMPVLPTPLDLYFDIRCDDSDRDKAD